MLVEHRYLDLQSIAFSHQSDAVQVVSRRSLAVVAEVARLRLPIARQLHWPDLVVGGFQSDRMAVECTSPERHLRLGPE